MSDARFHFGALALTLAAALAGCGTATAPGRGVVRVDGLQTGGQLLCGQPGQVVAITGSGFLSEHGTDVTVIFTALEGTPFDNGNSATEEVVGTAIDDNTIECPIPAAVGQIQATITVILPGLNYGISPPDVLDIGGVIVGPFANFDQYQATGNVTLSVAAGASVLVNDTPAFCGSGQGDDDDEVTPVKPSRSGPAADASDFVVAAYDQTTALGGTVQMNPDGSFDYDPPLGVGGTIQQPVYDSFTYTLDENGRQSVGFVQIGIAEVVWFIDDSVPPGGTGHFSSPFEALPPFNAVQGLGGDDQPQPGDWIFVYQGGAPYDGGITLLDGQKLIGQGVDLVVGGQLIVPASARPSLTNTGVDPMGVPCIVLANANRIEGLTVWQPTGHGIVGFDVTGPTTVDHVLVTGTGQDGILLEGDCTGTFDFGTDVSVVDAAGVGVHVNGLGRLLQGPADSTALTFDGLFTYEGSISQTDAGQAVVVFDTSPGSSVVFRNGTIHYDGTSYAGDGAIDLEAVLGTVQVTSPQTILGSPAAGIFVYDCAGTLTFSDTTIDVYDDGFSNSGVELLQVGAATLTFTNLDITVLGDTGAVTGAVGIRAGNLGGDSITLLAATGVTSLTVDGASRIDMTDAEDACVITGDPLSPFDLDITLQSLGVDGSPQTGGLLLSECLGSFTVTGTTTITNFDSAGILFLNGNCDLTFATLNVSNATGQVGRGVDLLNNGGMFTANAGTFSNFTLDGVIVHDSGATLNNVAFSSVGVDVIELVGNVVLGGTGNTATTFGNLCDSTAMTGNTGVITFTTPSATCP